MSGPKVPPFAQCAMLIRGRAWRDPPAPEALVGAAGPAPATPNEKGAANAAPFHLLGARSARGGYADASFGSSAKAHELMQ
jgi:hypothetical protein